MWFFSSAILTVSAVAMSDIKSDEVVVFYPTYARLDEQSKTWTALVHGVIFEPEKGSWRRAWLADTIRRTLRVESGTAESEILSRRVRLFLVDNERGKDISIRIGDQVHRVGTSGANGHFRGEVRLSADEADDLLRNRDEAEGGWISFSAVTRKGDNRRFTGRVQLVGKTGLSIISDIDDTIKHSQVGDRQAMLANTFLRQFKPVPGMAELYRECARRGAVFHYVSGSPWQLYRPLAGFFRAEGFPPGSFGLKLFRLKDSSALNLVLSQEKSKPAAIEPILAAFPDRRFVLIGDSGEQDPEIYGKLARNHGDQIVAICIRNVTEEHADSERFRKAFEGLEKVRWKLFEQAEDVRPLLRELSLD